MGLESYDMSLLPDGAGPTRVDIDGLSTLGYKGHSDFDANAICDAILASFEAKEVRLEFPRHRRKFIVEDAIEVWIYEEDSLFQVAVLVGCFAWYEPGLDLMYRVACVINDQVEVQLFHFINRFVPLTTKEAFIEHVRSIYADKYRAFVRSFGDREVKIAPGSGFYRYYRRSKHLLWRVFWWIRDRLTKWVHQSRKTRAVRPPTV